MLLHHNKNKLNAATEAVWHFSTSMSENSVFSSVEVDHLEDNSCYCDYYHFLQGSIIARKTKLF